MNVSATATARSPIAVVGASGGVGASSLAVALAIRAAALGHHPLLVDLDLTGGGLDVIAAAETATGQRWPHLREVRGEVSATTMARLLPRVGSVALLSACGDAADLADEAVDSVVASLCRGPFTPVLDTPRSQVRRVLGHGPRFLVIASLNTRGLSDAEAVTAAIRGRDDGGFGPGEAPLPGLVLRGSKPGLHTAHDVAAHLGMRYLAHLPADPAVIRDAERGRPPGQGRDALRHCVDSLVEPLFSRAAA